MDDELSTFNDHYIFRKHQEIYPSDEEIDSMQEALDLIENCLREVAEKVKKLSIQFDHKLVGLSNLKHYLILLHKHS